MPENRVAPGPVCGNMPAREAVCVHTTKVYDSCRDKECLMDLRLYPTRCSQHIIDASINLKPRKAELLWTYIDVEPVPFNCGFFTVDVKYFYKVTLDAFCGLGRPQEVCGLCTFDKRTVLFGSEGSVRIFSSKFIPDANDIQTYEKTNLPTAVVEVVDPITLGVKLCDSCESKCSCCLNEVPEGIGQCFNDDLVVNDEGKVAFVTLGQFSIIRLERDIKLVMPAYDICLPEKECSGTAGDACDLFDKFKFPVDEFFPPRLSDIGCCNDFRKKR